ncbi:restriction endonuclease subunit S [Muribaculaceae bacterium S4]|nr:restriction endonuclease subunit S [Muribaculaceae bacterium S4]
MATNKTDKVLNVPTLRFPGFTEEWQKSALGDICTVQMCKRIFAHQTSEVGDVPFYKIGTIGGIPDSYISKELFDEYRCKYNYPQQGEVMITCAGTVGKAIPFDGADSYFQDSNIVWLSNPTDKINNKFLYYIISRVDWSRLNSTTITRIYNDDLRKLGISYPNRTEQKKIADFLSLLDDRIALQSKLIEDLKKLKSAIRANIFQRLKNAPTHTKSGAELLLYEQPTKYIVEDYEYSSDKTQTPVLTANKSLILGYTSENFGVYDKGNCIILDDFTLDMKFITFPFKVKSSAIKILTAKCGVNLRFIFEQLQWMGLTPLGHNRHYISMVEPMQFYCPSIEVQRNIAQLLDKADDKLRNELQLLELLIKQKSFLLSAMFI